jgi:hypothetical protein
MNNSVLNSALSMAQLMLSAMPSQGRVVTRELIAQTVDTILSIHPTLPPDEHRELMIEELETRFHVWIGNLKALGDNTDHIAWLPATKAEINWGHWNRYKLFLQESMADSAIQRLDEITDDVLGRLENPDRQGGWSRRGLVVGHVQSGKTANYIGLVNKAVDAGYKLIIILAGMHRNLRAQTQIRLDEGFLGYVSSPPLPGQSSLQPVGVGLRDPSLRPDSITNRRDDGDFTRSVAQQFNIGPGSKPLLFVVKKNSSVLRNILEWVEWAANSFDVETGRRVVRGVPLLVIDDEADQGSVDTKELEIDENGVPDDEHNPTIINSRIRRLLYCFERNAYVGYTATPFANIYIHEKAATIELGEDLFPRSFIVSVPAPSNYFGPSSLFGHSPAEDGSERKPNLIRYVTDFVDEKTVPQVGWMPSKHRNGHAPLYKGQKALPPSLREAMRAFVLATAARRARGGERDHHSMLVHVTRFINVQQEVYSQVSEELSDMRLRWRNEQLGTADGLRSQLHDLWENDFAKTVQPHSVGQPVTMWTDIESQIWPTLDSMVVKEINGTSSDVLAYQEARETGLTVIAIGGDKLSRGLTLEGLSVSYFLRSASMYDTLMQMGRWFGYRPKYEELCRLYMTKELREWFDHITNAAEELREQFDHMVAVGATPREYGLRVQSHPVLLVTSRVKSRHSIQLQLSYAGAISETVTFHRDVNVVNLNVDAVVELLTSCGLPEESPSRSRPQGRERNWRGSYLWQGVSADKVVSLLRRMKFHPRAYRVHGELLAQYILGQNQHAELTQWSVALLSAAGGKQGRVGPYPLSLVQRANEAESEAGYYAIRRLLSPEDEAIDLECDDYEAALIATQQAWTIDPGRSRRETPPEQPSGPMLRRQRKPQNGLLLIYPLDPASVPVKDEADRPTSPIVGIGVSFPGSKTDVKVDYRVNSIYYEQELGILS